MHAIFLNAASPSVVVLLSFHKIVAALGFSKRGNFGAAIDSWSRSLPLLDEAEAQSKQQAQLRASGSESSPSIADVLNLKQEAQLGLASACVAGGRAGQALPVLEAALALAQRFGVSNPLTFLLAHGPMPLPLAPLSRTSARIHAHSHSLKPANCREALLKATGNPNLISRRKEATISSPTRMRSDSDNFIVWSQSRRPCKCGNFPRRLRAAPAHACRSRGLCARSNQGADLKRSRGRAGLRRCAAHSWLCRHRTVTVR